MDTVSAHYAKTHLPRLLERVAQGETIIITKHGRSVACLVPAPELRRGSVAATIEAIEEFRRGHTLGDLSIRELIEEGRRH